MDPDDHDSWLMFDPPPPGPQDAFLMWEAHAFTDWRRYEPLAIPEPPVLVVPAPSPVNAPRPRSGRDPDGRKSIVTATVRVQATFISDAQPVLDRLWSQWHPTRGQSFVVTHGEADGNKLRIQTTYTARGANTTDVRRKVLRAARDATVEPVGEVVCWTVKEPTALWELPQRSQPPS